MLFCSPFAPRHYCSYSLVGRGDNEQRSPRLAALEAESDEEQSRNFTADLEQIIKNHKPREISSWE
jgi:hypothetical protein